MEEEASKLGVVVVLMAGLREISGSELRGWGGACFRTYCFPKFKVMYQICMRCLKRLSENICNKLAAGSFNNKCIHYVLLEVPFCNKIVCNQTESLQV